jgi:hypothetical protein
VQRLLRSPEDDRSGGEVGISGIGPRAEPVLAATLPGGDEAGPPPKPSSQANRRT